MLQDGFHKSFCELFALIKQQEDDRLSAGPESLMWSMRLLKDEHEKLDMLKVHLTKAETASRKGLFKILSSFLYSGNFCNLLVTFANSLDPDQDRQNIGLDLDPNRLTLNVPERFFKSINMCS